MKQANKPAALKAQSHTVWAELYLDYHLKGQISVMTSGARFVEGELDGLKWSQASGYMVNVAALCRRVFQLPAEDLLIRTRLVEDNESRMRPVVVIIGKGQCKNPEMLNALLSCLVEKTIVQASLKFVEPDAQLPEEVRQLVNSSAALYLASNGGQHVQRQMLLMADQFEVATIRGFWKEEPSTKPPEKKKVTVTGLYEGRLYRSHVLHIISKGSRARQYVIPYDVEKFDAFLRGLNENKHALLKVVFLTEDDGQEKPLELVAAEVVEAPEELELN